MLDAQALATLEGLTGTIGVCNQPVVCELSQLHVHTGRVVTKGSMSKEVLKRLQISRSHREVRRDIYPEVWLNRLHPITRWRCRLRKNT